MAGTSPVSVVTAAAPTRPATLPRASSATTFGPWTCPNFLNYIENTVTWDELPNGFRPGRQLTAAPLFCWHDPISQAWFQYVQGSLPFGLCFGYTMLATEFLRGEATPGDFGAAERRPVESADKWPGDDTGGSELPAGRQRHGARPDLTYRLAVAT